MESLKLDQDEDFGAGLMEETKQTSDIIVFPITLKFPVVAKFLCSNGRVDRYLNFQNPYELFLEREPLNKYDPKAIKVGVMQAESHLLQNDFSPGEDTQDREELMQSFYLGYVPKELAYNLSVIVDN